ncbi:hypothetical protein OHR68_29705 [Spirillospora sp. NBC_00431]
MTALAAEHLTDLERRLHTKHLDRDIRSRTIPPELARLTHVLARYYDQLADGFSVPHPANTGVRDAAHRASALLRQAEHFLGPPAHTQTPRSALAQKLRATSIALGCGLDLLSTHFPTTTDQAISPNATVITAPDTARSLLHQLSTHTATIGHLARHTNAPTNQAGPLLLKAAILAHIYSESQTTPTLTAVPLHHIPDRIPPQLNEHKNETLAGINASIHRLTTPTTRSSIPTWRYLARAAAIICDLNHKTVQQLIYRLNELNDLDHLPAFQQAAADVRHTGRAWKTIIRHWDEHIGYYGHPADGPATDASDLILRLGRLIHADPAWTPSPRASPRLKPPHDLAPDPTHAADLLTITLKTTEACNTIAGHHTAIHDAAAISVLNRQKRFPTHQPRVTAPARQLSTRYNTAQERGHQSITTLGQAIQNLRSPIPEEARLIIHRTTISVDQLQPKLAASDFPTTVTDCLDKQESPPASSIHFPPQISNGHSKH